MAICGTHYCDRDPDYLGPILCPNDRAGIIVNSLLYSKKITQSDTDLVIDYINSGKTLKLIINLILESDPIKTKLAINLIKSINKQDD